MNLNERAWRLCDRAVAAADELRIAVAVCDSGARLLDFGVQARGGLAAGVTLAEICLAGLGDVAITAAPADLWHGPAVLVRTDHPLAACMAAQYAGWQVAHDGYFAMGSGPMRAASGREPLFDAIGWRQQADHVVGVLESRKLPPPDVCGDLAAKCGVDPSKLTLAVAPTSSQAGTVQIVARSVETALHKLFELGYDLSAVESGLGIAPLPPVAADDLAAIGRTNDAILYGAEVTLWVRGKDDELEAVGRRVPSSASPDHGRPFAEIFKHYGGDFYRIDPHLFSPAVVTLINLATGRSFRFGHTVPRIVHESFGTLG
jgi:methenyltetrahydromethanopterin cyclohydrolase